MNNDLVRVLRKKMHLYANNVNGLIKKHTEMKANDAEVSELNSVALKAHSFNIKYSEVKEDYDKYVSMYEKCSSLSKTGGKKYNEAHQEFLRFESDLLSKYNVKAKTNVKSRSTVKKEEIKEESYDSYEIKKGSKLLAGALILASSLGFGYGLSACTSNNEPSIIINDDDISKSEPVPDDTKKKEMEHQLKEPDDDTIIEPIGEEMEHQIKEPDDDTINEPKNKENNIPTQNPIDLPNESETINTNDFAYLKEDASLYDKKTDDKQELEKIDKYQKVLRISTDGNYDYVQTEDLQYGFIESNKLEVLPDMYVEVDISDQTVKLYKDKGVILTTLCVTGKDSTPTRIGYFPIKYKTYDTYLKGPGYNSHVYYWMPFDGGIGLHDAAWRSEFGGDIHYNSGSHGCVNMPHDAAKTIYDNVSAGTKVLVHN